MADAHNCYPYEGRWADRVDRALGAGYPIAIEQDLAWYLDPSTGQGRVVVSHTPKTTGTEPTEKDYFFEHVRPVVEKALNSPASEHAQWPIIVLHFDFKDNRPALLHALWDLLGQYEPWITTARKSGNAHHLSKLDRKPILVLTEDSDAQEKVFYRDVPAGGTLRLFGSAHTTQPRSKNKEELIRLATSVSPAELLTTKATDYRRWWNNSWYEVEEGGQRQAGEWTDADAARLRALVERAHSLGYWIRFYTLDGFTPDEGKANGWLPGYNFGSAEAVQQRWRAAMDAGVDLIASDQYEELAKRVAEHDNADAPR